MSVVYIDRTIDCIKENYKCEKVTGYEHGVKVFRFKPLNGNIPIDLSDCTGAAYVGTKSDGKVIGNACEIKDNKILLPLSLQMTTARGDLKGHVEIYYSTGTLKFFGVDFEVFPSPETAEIESKDEFTLLESKIAEVNKIIAEGIETSQGKSAYEIAVENGFEGTEAEWLESLKGEKGADGKDGIDGKNGVDGQDGKDGTNGADGRGITSTEINASGELVLTYSDNATANVGAVVGAKGNKGDKGDTGATGADGQDGKNYQVEIIESTETTVELQPNKFYKFGEVTELNLSLAEITDNTQLNEFMFEFVSGETATTLTLPDTIKWAETPDVEANKIYQCSIVNNVGLIVGVVNV